MAVIKQVESSRSTPFNFGDIAVEARAIITRAERQAEGVLAQANVDRDRIVAEARAAGYAEGLAAGQEEGRKAARDEAIKKFEQQIGRVGKAFGEAIEQLAACRGRMLAEARQDLVALALSAAEKIVRQQLAADPSAGLRIVEAAVELAGQASRLLVQVNPSDLETVQSFAPQLAARLTGSAEVKVVGDAAVESGGCRLTAWRETGQASDVDATIQTQLTRLANELLGKGDEA
ncbi:MAG: FliH/SctL family protein [Phycisphaerae bacterium]|nr:FliH/SctL family protein [Phycisphaerae bacterium]